MKILTISDPHFHPFQQFSEVVSGTSSRLLDVKKVFDAAVDLGVKEGCELMLIPGDIFHVRGAIRPSTINVVLDCFERAQENFPVVVIPGNHDMEDKGGRATAIDFLRTLNNVYVMGSSSRIAIRGVSICGIPYQPSLSDFEEVVLGMEEYLHNCNIVMIHQGVDDLADKGVPETGLTVKKLQEYFGKKATIIAGHYHRPVSKKNVYQIGAPLQHNFGDEGQKRGAWIFELDSENNFKLAEFFPINITPRFETVGADYESVLASNPKKFDGAFLRVKAASSDEGKKAVELIKPKASSIVIEREYSSVHGVVMKVGSVQSMVKKYFEFISLPEDKAKNALNLYEEICK